RFQLVQAAVTDHDGTVTMYVARPEDGRVQTQLSSIHRDVILRHDISGVDPVEVPAIRLDRVLCLLDRVDLLYLDTEGHDAAILAQLDLSRVRPDVVVYESMHLAVDERSACEA